VENGSVRTEQGSVVDDIDGFLDQMKRKSK